MVLGNKLNITDSAELARREERISKARVLELFEKGLPDKFEAGTFQGLAQMPQSTFDKIIEKYIGLRWSAALSEIWKSKFNFQ